LVAQLNEQSVTERAAVIDVLPWLGKTTLDIIGLAGFDYNFNALSSSADSPDELYTAFHTLFNPSVKIGVLQILQALIPVLRHLVCTSTFTVTFMYLNNTQPTKRRREMRHSKAVMDRVSRHLVSEKKAAILALYVLVPVGLDHA
jgi:hypothetical protein